MLKARIIPTLLWKDHGLVKGVGFDSGRRVGAVLPAIKVYNIREVDEMIVVDITAGRDGREPDFETIAEFTTESFVPLTVGGGVRKLEDVQRLLQAGADKVAINSAAFADPGLVRGAANRFGAQCVVLSVDVRRGADGGYECFRTAGTQPTGREVVAWCREMEAQGAGEILLTSIERDGTMEGYDLELIRRVTSAVSIPVIASGGAGNYGHLHEALVAGQASAVAAASIFHFTQQTPLEAKSYLAQKGIPVRNVRQNSGVIPTTAPS